ncbi:hypothetical protein [Paraburkholderia azotifigens]|uniref:Uncharacterized protein n=2 Tax=Paraburkholderia azotifigens TaxID=2057004 RepID=A0ABU9QZH8_9BURK
MLDKVKPGRWPPEDGTMRNFYNSDLARSFGYGMAVYIAAQTSALQHGIDATNMRRRAAGRRLLEDATVEEVISALRSNGMLPARPNARGAGLSDADAIG